MIGVRNQLLNALDADDYVTIRKLLSENDLSKETMSLADWDDNGKLYETGEVVPFVQWILDQMPPAERPILDGKTPEQTL